MAGRPSTARLRANGRQRRRPTTRTRTTTRSVRSEQESLVRVEWVHRPRDARNGVLDRGHPPKRDLPCRYLLGNRRFGGSSTKQGIESSYSSSESSFSVPAEPSLTQEGDFVGSEPGALWAINPAFTRPASQRLWRHVEVNAPFRRLRTRRILSKGANRRSRISKSTLPREPGSTSTSWTSRPLASQSRVASQTNIPMARRHVSSAYAGLPSSSQSSSRLNSIGQGGGPTEPLLLRNDRPIGPPATGGRADPLDRPIWPIGSPTRSAIVGRLPPC